MIPLTTVTVTRSETSPWLASVYAGVFTAIVAAAFVLAFQAEIPILYIIAFFLIGAGPVLGYQMATGRLGSEWGGLIGGIIGSIPLLGVLLWPILVGAFARSQSVGRLFLGSLIGIILATVVFALVATAMGDNPGWLAFGFTLLCAVWGGACGAFMVAWGRTNPMA